MKNILINSIILSIGMLIIGCDPDEPTPLPPVKLDCESIYPIYESVITTTPFIFEWCVDENATEYHLQASLTEDFGEIIFDTVTVSNAAKSVDLILVNPTTGEIYEFFPFRWGTKYYWRVAAIKDTVQQDWSDTYIFETNDIRDDVVGTYEAEKRKLRINHNGNFIYYDSIYSIHQIEVEKLENSRGIRVKDITAGDFDLELSRDLGLNVWLPEYEIYTFAEFKIDIDSFEIRDMPCDSPGNWPCTGYRYSGRE